MGDLLRKLLAQPLVHFLFLGSFLFVLYQWQSGSGNGESEQITVDREKLLTFMQYRSKAFNSEVFGSKLDAMGEDERQALIDDLVREEVLFRESKSLGLDRDDYVIKRRLIQKLEFITQGFIDSATQVERADVEAHFASHQADYFIESYTTFTHVYFSVEKHGKAQAEKLALEMHTQLDQNQVAFADAIQFGDRFLYHTNYVERTPDYIASHFGPSMAKSVFDIETDIEKANTSWQGPFESPYGYHLVLVADSQAGRVPDLDEVYEQVRADTQQVLIRQKTTQAIDEIVNRYQVTVEDVRS